jgi:acyl-CoA synthetase (AMP-forming)/AMP-acid ligase II
VTTRLLHPSASLVDAASGRVLEGDALRARVDAVAASAAGLAPGVVFALTPQAADAVVRLVGLVEAGRAVVLLDPGVDPAVLADLVARYAPVAVVGRTQSHDLPEAEGYAAVARGDLGTVLLRGGNDAALPHERLRLLLTTSGSTGSPKLVRLSEGALLSNAESIAAALSLGPDEVALTSLPLFYSYGLSVLTSHLTVGARVVVSDRSLLQREFWNHLDTYGVTSLPGVPYQYEMLKRLRFDPAKHPSLRALTQAGGRLDPELVADFAGRMTRAGGRLVVMYGQTEATARMSVMPAEHLASKPGSVGLPIPGGSFSIDGPNGPTSEPGVTGEVLYRGPNVMLGYAEEAADLGRDDDLGGSLATGDLGYLDDEGFLFLTGRLKRIGKVFGVRVNLDDVERMLRDAALVEGPAAAVSGNDRLRVFVEGADSARCATVARELAGLLLLHPTGFEVSGVDRLPLLSSGKIDYARLERSR